MDGGGRGSDKQKGERKRWRWRSKRGRVGKLREQTVYDEGNNDKVRGNRTLEAKQ